MKSNLLLSLLIVASLLVAAPACAMTDAEVDALFNEALAQSRSGDLTQAISAFETILGERPGSGRVRLELALANFRALNYSAARSHAREVLANPDTPAQVRANVEAFLEQVERQSKQNLFTPYITFGYIHDDNVNVGPDTSVIDLGAATLTLAPGSNPISADGLQISAGINHRYLFENTIELFGDHAAAAWQSQVGIFRNHYFDEDDFHLNVISARTGPALLAARKWGLRLNGDFNHIMIGDEDIAIYGGLNPSVDIYLDNSTILTVDGRVQWRDFDRRQDQDRDSEYYEIGGAIGHFFSDWPASLRVGFSYFSEDADTSRRSNDGWIANVGVEVRPIDNVSVFFNYLHRDREYDGVEPIFAVNRDENEDRFVVGGSYRLPITGPLAGLTANVTYTNTDNSSNVPIFEYDREQVVVSLSKTF